MYRAVFEVPEGRIYANFPDDMSLGDHITGTVYPEPSGKNKTEHERNAKNISAYTVEMEGLKSIAGRRIDWIVPPQARSGHSTIRLHDRGGKTVAQCDLPVSPLGGAPRPASTAAIVLPLGGAAGGGVSVWGSFVPDANPSVSVAGMAAQVLAQSPRKIVFLGPRDVVGPSTLDVKTGALAASGPYRVLGVNSTVSRRDLHTGQPATLTSIVSGLQDLPEPAVLVIVNRSPSTIALQGGAFQRIAIRPADVRPGGTYQVTRTFTGELIGDFDIEVAVTLPPTAQLPLQRLAERYVDRWSQTSQVAVAGEARALIAAGVVAARLRLDDWFLSQLGFRTDPASALNALVSDYCYELRDRKLASLGPLGRLEPPRRPRMANAFAPQAVSPAGSIEPADVRARSFVQFLADFLTRHTPGEAYGTLYVTSDPDKQKIKIKEVTGVEYFTARSLDLSVREYSVTVGPCTQVVTVRANQSTTVNCPKQ